ncbi:MAG: penicillin-binding transpeptidase domain-containing protein, partial [Deferrisomatales bacterium]|nr:penicillin-binding transpeptidase domain-containing protein [Deferrisomatales bacterium]
AGLSIFTTLDPRVQGAAEAALGARIRELESSGVAGDGPLQGAAVVVQPATGEVLALVGGREVRYAGFNRALDARRPIGSLVKPAVFLAALENPDRYTLATVVQDTDLRVTLADGTAWAPANYDRQAHGPVTLYEALVRSHNLATARLGMEVGVERVVDTLHRLGVRQELAPYPALLLGAVELSPLEVAGVYQTLANGGLHTPLRAIRSVVDAAGKPLESYPLRLLAGVAPGPLFLVDAALRGVVAEGTGSGLQEVLPEGWAVAGKTGTTDDLRDSWFAGYTADWLGVVWLGLDDNRPCGLSGATGALRVWGDLYSRIGGRSLDPTPPEGVEYAWVDRLSGERTNRGARGAAHLPFLTGSVPGGGGIGVWRRLKRWVGGETE